MFLHERKVSTLPLSIGTAFALESLFYIPSAFERPDLPPAVALTKYKTCFINVRTLLRNLENSVSASDYIYHSPSAIRDFVLEEMKIIEAVFENEGARILTPVFYFSEYAPLRNHRYVKLREPTTLLRKQAHRLNESALAQIRRASGKIHHTEDLLGNAITPFLESVILLTHHAYDLLAAPRFASMALLESHTGVLKVPHQWSSKYAKIPESPLTHLPFTRSLLYIFGDAHQIAPLKASLRPTILEIAKKERWTPFTPETMVKIGFKKGITHPLDLQILLSL